MSLSRASARKRRRAVSAGRPRRHRLSLPPAPGKSDVDLSSMSPAMVDRLFWRAGFGPTAQDRAQWTGRPVSEAVGWLLSTPAGVAGSPGTRDGKPLDPTADDTDLVLSWIDRMVRSTNPFVERLTFFWHRHWATSRAEVSPPQLMLRQNDVLRRFADLGPNANASFRDLARELTIDPAMLRFLTGERNVRGAPNENYARELMELFGLGVTDAAGKPNYSENDVQQLSKALSGWQVDDRDPDQAKSYFTPDRWYNGPKIVFGSFGNYKYEDAVDLVLARPSHAPFLVSKLWGEFVAAPLDGATLQKLVATYTGSGLKLRPLLEQLLTQPALFASLDEPDMVKPPVVFTVGAMRALGAGVTGTSAADHLDAMGQVPYFPPTVAGWEGGLSWLNTNTALARFGFVAELVAEQKIDDVLGETASAAYDRAYAAVGSPWLAPGTEKLIRDYAGRAPSSSTKLRKERQLMLRALMLAGPDGQVM
ncbi:MAG: DUF1800 domain-containing protein [Solirubrobacteraceae bacterium]|jgi:uncharacterized protein (DUF1800 family)|nr:DUF1800 domain-containing protein [Solirubrobacteraceae bacterium]